MSGDRQERRSLGGRVNAHLKLIQEPVRSDHAALEIEIETAVAYIGHFSAFG